MMRESIQYALDNAGILSPHIADNVNLLVDQQTSDRLSGAFQSREPDGGRSDEESLARGPLLDE